jgi:hypothetical protein
MKKRQLDKIALRAQRISAWMRASSAGRQWLSGDGWRRAASVPGTSGNVRDERGHQLSRLVEQDVPALVETVRELNLRPRQGDCRYCGEPLRLMFNPDPGLYSMYTSPQGVIVLDPNCPDERSADGFHHDGR